MNKMTRGVIVGLSHVIVFIVSLYRYCNYHLQGAIEPLLGRLRVIWHEAYIREDEFHRSLSMDSLAMMHMSKEKQERYVRLLLVRRGIAHFLDGKTGWRYFKQRMFYKRSQ